ncbi:blue light sensor protein [Sphingomonas sp. MAH-20]|uniref:Blue light sensor protein n=1 Tax=Sphingomonas horti TaxID=2682842 RepID=A0A6I4IYU8_9SPHN|nr:BLUF domain-containing protein [Sphingomonas sp. CGMCC 1.13658]MBA2918279.1 BLUF domain-containing protein [Sphingomonas sp. CGMCC 1.13658]MVO77246.1 blue light sensor protein [Sphingomonas horti]
MYSLVYVSKCLLTPDYAGAGIEAIIEVATARNAATGVTGALLYTGARFAQLLEGEKDAVLAIMASIARDPRHGDIVILDQRAASARRFSHWSLVYGHSTFAAGIVERALAAHGHADEYPLRNLIRLLQELAPSAG